MLRHTFFLPFQILSVETFMVAIFESLFIEAKLIPKSKKVIVGHIRDVLKVKRVKKNSHYTYFC